MHLRNWCVELIAKTTNLMYRLNVQVTVYGRQTVPDRGVLRSCDPLQNFWGSNYITGTAEPKAVKFCTRVGYINFSNRMTYHQQKVWLWSRDCFVVMQRVARVCQRQLSYLLPLESTQSLYPELNARFVQEAHPKLFRDFRNYVYRIDSANIS